MRVLSPVERPYAVTVYIHSVQLLRTARRESLRAHRPAPRDSGCFQYLSQSFQWSVSVKLSVHSGTSVRVSARAEGTALPVIYELMPCIRGVQTWPSIRLRASGELLR